MTALAALEKEIHPRRFAWPALGVVLLFSLVGASVIALGRDLPSDLEKRNTTLSIYEGFRKSFPSVPDVTAEEALNLVEKDKALLVDVRTEREQQVSMLPGAVTQRDFKKNPDAFRGKVVLVYCTIGWRSAGFAESMRKQGLAVVNVKGGLLAWAHAGGTFHHQGLPTKNVHVYSREYNLLPAEFSPRW